MNAHIAATVATCTLLIACAPTPVAPRASGPATVSTALRAAPAGSVASDALRPNFNLEVILRAPAGSDGFGHVKFRQANDDATIVDLGVWVRDLAPNTHYKLQRAVDTSINDVCTSTSWLTLGLGLTPADIVTDDRGTATADLYRVLTTAPGAAFDIKFRVVTAATRSVVLTSECYQFFVR